MFCMSRCNLTLSSGGLHCEGPTEPLLSYISLGTFV